MKIILLPQAKLDLDLISEPLFSRVIQRLKILKKFPALGAPMTGPFYGFRSTVVDLFRVVYRILPSKIIEVAYIRDCRQRPLD